MGRNFKGVKTTSFLAEGTELNGTLRIKGGIRIDGKVKGKIESASVVFLGSTARVQADIRAEAVISSGRVVGDILSAKHVAFSKPGSIKGTVQTRELILEKGVAFDGSCRIIEPEA